MKHSMLDILACPIDKHYPLQLVEFEMTTTTTTTSISGEVADVADEVREGILYCPKCLRYYPIMDEIPIMLPDELRNKAQDIDFLKVWRDKVPEKILREGNPWHL